MDFGQVIRSQYLASLEMLKQAILKCPDDIWDDPNDRTKFWHIAFHALFYAHLYLQNTEQDFMPWAQHRKDYQFLGPLPWPPHRRPEIGEPYTKEQVLAYLELCQQQVAEKTAKLNLEADSGFAWLKFNKFELALYNIRHLQQHAGELMERLGTRANIDVDWISAKHE